MIEIARTCRILIVSVLVCSVPKNAEAQAQVRCGGLEITAEAADKAAAERACKAVTRADHRLRELGLEHERPLLIEVTEELDFGAGYCMAYYDAEAERLQVLSEPCLEDNPPPESAFPVVSAAVLFESLIHHELTHAYLDQTLEGRPLPRAAHEYLAYAIQIEMLPESVRAQFLNDAHVSLPATIEELNEAMLFMAPSRFAAAAWFYFQQNGGGPEAVERVLAGHENFRRSR
ncbi:DUF6639 family protein [Salibaculum sp.]|uniref:DUF6639 family protein n=1 Tax=Salibaculum sp. TaxID=2855480 RepID=UPI002B486D76|nr:DUF6639 family protein [Salibaculum sp.]HKL68400.1 DUF6639 family protein [Salibaculum sp.]